MAKELSADVSLVKMTLKHNINSLDEAYRLMATARTTVPDEVKSQYLRDQGVSTVQADVHIDAVGKAQMSMAAVATVKLTYKEDVVRSSPMTRKKINQRIQQLAQKHCQERVFAEIVQATKGGRPK